MRANDAGGTNLHITHSWGGGIMRWQEDFAQADRFSSNLALECVGTRHCYGIGHRLRDLRTGREIASWVHDDPINEFRISHRGYRELLESVIADYRVDHLYASSLTGHTLDVFDLGLPVVRVHHDFFPYCPALHCYRDGVCTQCRRHELELCTQNSFYAPLNSPATVLRQRDLLLSAYALPHVTHVVPSPTVVDQLCRLDSRFSCIRFQVVPHGIALTRQARFAGASDHRRLRVAMLGHLQWPKGLSVLQERYERLRLTADFVLLGAGAAADAFRHRYGFEVVEQYDWDQLPTLVDRFEIDVALFLSIVPETFSYTLSEVWAMGIPPLAPEIGSFVDRIEHGHTGWLFRSTDDSVGKELLRLDCDRDEIRRVASEVSRLEVRSCDAMVDDYYALRGSRARVRLLSPRLVGRETESRAPKTEESE